MGDDDANQATDTDEDRSSPGGGPKRVVSESSVDDILNSIGGQPDDSGGERETPNHSGGEQSEREGRDEDTAEAFEDAALSDRVDRGAVTGADVRRAETGDGRESTPEIDEIDLSLDDIDASSVTSAESGVGANRPGDGSDAANARGKADDETTSGTGESETLLGRLKRLFSR